jgi:hypothetical protein
LPHALAPHLLHGAMPPRERTKVLHSFSRSGRLLLATDAASEGLNLHERCRLVVHFELPWMPARLEQRSGRVDRLGQTQRVHELLLVARDTAERLVLAPLVRRMRTAAAQGHRSITALDEWSVARLIIAGSSVEDSAPLKTSTSSLDLRIEAEIECGRLITHRRIRTRTSEFRSADDLAVSTLSPRRPGFTWIIVELGLKDPSGRVVHSELVPLVLRIQSTLRSGSRAEARCWGTSLADCLRTRVAALASRERSTFLDEARERIGIATDGLKRRERWIADATPATAQALVQAGLFDRRAIRAAAARSVVSRQLEVEAAHRLRILEEEQAVHLDVRVVALGGRM